MVSEILTPMVNIKGMKVTDATMRFTGDVIDNI